MRTVVWEGHDNDDQLPSFSTLTAKQFDFTLKSCSPASSSTTFTRRISIQSQLSTVTLHGYALSAGQLIVGEGQRTTGSAAFCATTLCWKEGCESLPSTRCTSE